MTELRIPTVAVSVELVLGPQTPRHLHGELFVPQHNADAVLDAIAASLDGATEFVPFRVGGGIQLVSKASLIYLKLALPAESELMTLYDRQHYVEIVLAQGSRFQGLLLDSSPADRPRVIDHLNHTVRFVRLWTPQELVLIQKSQIATVVELPGQT